MLDVLRAWLAVTLSCFSFKEAFYRFLPLLPSCDYNDGLSHQYQTWDCITSNDSKMRQQQKLYPCKTLLPQINCCKVPNWNTVGHRRTNMLKIFCICVNLTDSQWPWPSNSEASASWMSHIVKGVHPVSVYCQLSAANLWNQWKSFKLLCASNKFIVKFIPVVVEKK